MHISIKRLSQNSDFVASLSNCVFSDFGAVSSFRDSAADGLGNLAAATVARRPAAAGGAPLDTFRHLKKRRLG
jgi:hypothetical protein